MRSSTSPFCTLSPSCTGSSVIRPAKGDVLLRIDPIQTEAETQSSRAQHEGAVADARGQEFQIMNAEADLAKQEASLRSARAELDQAENNHSRMQSSLKRTEQLHEEGVIYRE